MMTWIFSLFLMVAVILTGCSGEEFNFPTDSFDYSSNGLDESNDESPFDDKPEYESHEPLNIVTLQPHAEWHEQYAIMRELELSDADIFYDLEYVLLVKREEGWFTDGKDAWFKFAFLGGMYTDFDSGNALYEMINALYTVRRDPVGIHAETDRAGLFRHLFERHVIGVSSGGTRVLTQTVICEYGGGHPILFEVFEGVNRLTEFTGPPSLAIMSTTPNKRFTTDTMGRTYVCVQTDNEFTISSSEHIFNFDETRFAYSVREDDGVVIKIYDICYGENVFMSDLLATNFVYMRHLGNNHVIFEHGFNYYKLDIPTNTVTFLFTKPSGVISPDGRFLAFMSVQPWGLWEHAEYTDGLDFGIFIYKIATGKAVFYPIDVAYSDFWYSIVSWTNISGLYELLEG